MNARLVINVKDREYKNIRLIQDLVNMPAGTDPIEIF